MNSGPSLVVIVNTYNQPEYLVRVLNGLARQTCGPDQLLVADDGSDRTTRDAIALWAKGQAFPWEHVWQEKQGFRRSRILNAAIAKSRSEYIVFLDGDSFPHPRFLEDHRQLARAGAFVQGHRALIERGAASYFGLGAFENDRKKALWGGQLRGWKHAFRWPRPLRRVRSDLRGVRGCNLAIWRSDLQKVNGYNEDFVGWGREDSELSVRLMNSGLERVDARGWALCYHLWHPPVSREGLATNDQLLTAALSTKSTRCMHGLDGHVEPLR